MNKYKLGFLGLLLSVSGCSFAYDINDSVDKAFEKIMKTDCTVSLSECRYYSVVEYIAFARACASSLNKRTKISKKELDDYTAKVEKSIQNWKAIDTLELKKAVFNKNNKFLKELTGDAEDYLLSLSEDSIREQCIKSSNISMNKMPEEHSDILVYTLNFEKWHKDIDLNLVK